MNKAPKSEYFNEFNQWLLTQGRSERTIKQYIYALGVIPEDVDSFFSNPKVQGKEMKIIAYRSYLRFLSVKKGKLSKAELSDALETYKPPKRRGNNHSDRKWSVPRSKWEIYIRKAPTTIAKMGIWIGFQFGLRLSEILHLRVQDINFQRKELLIRSHKQTKHQKFWHPKYNRDRQIPFTDEQAGIFKRWITRQRPKKLKHSYLLWTPNGNRKGEIVLDRTFQRWCSIAGVHPHILRYSFATHYYNESKDVKLISDLLGHANVATTSEYLQLGKKAIMNKARALFSQS